MLAISRGDVMGYSVRQCLLFVLSIAFSCNAFVYESCVLKKWNGKLGRYQYFVGLSDFHDNTHPANSTQLNQLQTIIQQSLPGLVIGSEDITSPGITRSETCGKFGIRAEGSILAGFAQACRSQKLPFNNFEYRYCRVAALGPVLNNVDLNMHNFDSTSQILVAALVKEIETVFDEIRAYQDGAVMRDFYNLCSVQVKGNMQRFGLYAHQNKSVADYLELMTTSQDRIEFIKRLLTFDSVVLDLRMLHSVLNEQQRGTYLMFAGGSHTSRVAQLLTKFGYEKVQNKQSNISREYNLGKCLGSNIFDGAYCQRPAPIDVQTIEQFLK